MRFSVHLCRRKFLNKHFFFPKSYASCIRHVLWGRTRVCVGWVPHPNTTWNRQREDPTHQKPNEITVEPRVHTGVVQVSFSTDHTDHSKSWSISDYYQYCSRHGCHVCSGLNGLDSGPPSLEVDLLLQIKLEIIDGCLLWRDKLRVRENTYIWVSV